MNQLVRAFQATTAVRESVPLLVGLTGPSGGGKSFSALRLATGIQTVTGGDIFGIDTEAKRMLHYADRFKFKHVPFRAPFGSLDYLEALKFCVKQGGKIIIVDSLSHEHDGDGGMIDYHDKELDRMAGNDFSKRERVKMLAWQKPKAARRALINGILQLEAHFIFCFRAKQTAKPIKIGGKTEVVNQGFMPISGEEFVFEQTVNCLLLPAAGGVPTWKSENMGERQMMKCPKQFEDIFATSQPLDEAIGRQLAEWAKGSGLAAKMPAQQHEDDFGEETATDRIRQLDDDLAASAERGMDALKAAWNMVPREYREALVAARDRRHKPRAAEIDRAASKQTESVEPTHAEPGRSDSSVAAQGPVARTPGSPDAGGDAAPSAEPHSEQEAPTEETTPAPPDPIAEAAKRGADAARRGFSRKSCPPEFREVGREKEAAAWADSHTREQVVIAKQ